jgi:Mn2+/Fe2+ NRAMP family transporter
MIPLLLFTSSRRVMGRYTNGLFLKIAGWSAATLITALDIYLLLSAFTGKK